MTSNHDELLAPKPATPATAKSNSELLAVLPFDDVDDFELVGRGLVATWPSDTIEGADGRVIWNFRSFDFLSEGAAPDSVNPSLWRQAALLTRPGLFEVCPGVWQVRGFDVSNISWIAGETGWIVVDPMDCVEVASAAYELVSEHLGRRPIRAVIYTHPHTDHFAGVGGVVTEEQYAAGEVQIIAGDGFMEAVAAESVLTGNAMGRRSLYYQGVMLPFGPTGAMTSGLGAPVAVGSTTLYPPTDLVSEDNPNRVIDGVEFQFQVTRETEAPVELNFYLPKLRALCMAENAGASQHNILTLRGAVVRDSKAWADALTESISLFADRTDVVFTSHFWPRWGTATIREYLENHRDTYKFLHDQSVRLLNKGLTPAEIAEELSLPKGLDQRWYNRGYYGSLSHNSKAVYQRYLGWYDGVPAHLWPLPPVPAAKRYVDAFGGAAATLELGLAAYSAGDYRWSAEVLNHLVFADAENVEARAALADTYQQLGFGAENGTWRNIYLTGALELRNGCPTAAGSAPFSRHVASALSGAALLDYLATKIDGSAFAEVAAEIILELTDEGSTKRVTLGHGVLIHEDLPDGQVASGGEFVRTTRGGLIDLVVSGLPVDEVLTAGSLEIASDAGQLRAILACQDTFEYFFPIVTP